MTTETLAHVAEAAPRESHRSGRHPHPGRRIGGLIGRLVLCLVFGLPVNGAFRHSREFLTVFGADEWLCVLEGTLAISNPETGEVERIPTGGSVFLRKDTWHHAFACDGRPLKVVEFFSPPPSTGSSGAAGPS